MTRMMDVRRTAIDAMRYAVPPKAWSGPGDLEIDAGPYLGDADAPIPQTLVAGTVRLLLRDGEQPGPGAAVVTGLPRTASPQGVRDLHERLFGAVWEAFRDASRELDAAAVYRVKTGTTSDGAIPVELYGSAWSFKALHIDRDALLFSHLYGPLAGFTGGGMLLVDARAYLARHGLGFDDAFEWSQEPTEGSKPMLREQRHAEARAGFGVNLGPIGPDRAVFVNNLPAAGILHGVTPVVPTGTEPLVRVFHRCSVKRIEDGQ
ncbi:hypothetical protein [Streptantibioticus silvisoli]|uniref:Uncharacterized protein n=1 Tax=Streptantibioticus silvisoli TaxID=2705255 RepID=A0ABT6VRS8_9ACTN|nr:hypothetical protein [Streptantibioticus silvisoli]MDI5961183.1 hypothetical protein [Streptantibioticus silvisoli]